MNYFYRDQSHINDNNIKIQLFFLYLIFYDYLANLDLVDGRCTSYVRSAPNLRHENNSRRPLGPDHSLALSRLWHMSPDFVNNTFHQYCHAIGLS